MAWNHRPACGGIGDQHGAEYATDGTDLEKIAYLAGNRKQVTDADNRITTVTYQAFDSPSYETPVRIEAPESRTTTYVRDVFGKPLTATQSGNWAGGAVSATRTWEYDAYQRLCRQTEPETNSAVVSYDGASQVSWVAQGQVGTGCPASAPTDATYFVYDLRGRKTTENYLGTVDDVSFGYDAVGNVIAVLNSTASWTYEYNKRNLLEREIVAIDGKSFVIDPNYDAQGTIASQVLPDGTLLNYGPDAWGRPTQINGYVTGAQYYPSGAVQSYSMANGTSFTQFLDGRLRPQVQQTKLNGTPIQHYVFGYSTGSDITAVAEYIEGADNASFTYDGLHRVKTAQGIWGNYEYAYDPLNNIRSRSGPNPMSYAYNASDNRLTSVSGGATRGYTYNNYGEVTGDGLRTFTINNAGQITQISGVADYAFDGNGKRIKATKAGITEYTLYDSSGSMVYSEKGAEKTNYLSLGQTTVELKNTGGAVETKYLHNDWLGSPRKATSASGATLWNEHYEPFGKKINGVVEKVGYTGHADDQESGLTYAQARYYDSLVGRFLSPDPVRMTDDFNLYAYVGNNPINATDPTGLESELRGLSLTKDEYNNQAKGLWGSLTPPSNGQGFSNDKDVAKASSAVAKAPTTATGDVESTAAQRGMAAGIAKATAGAKIGGNNQNYERALTIGTGANGEPVVTSIEVLGKQGGSIESASGEAVAHMHYKGLVQAPNSGDYHAAKTGRASFVFESTGKTWEVGRQDNNFVQRSIASDGTPGKWKPFGSQQ